MSTSNNGIVPYVAKYPMLKGFKKNGVVVPQQEWDKMVEKFPKTYGVFAEDLSRRQKDQERFAQEQNSLYRRKRELKLLSTAKNQPMPKRARSEESVNKKEIIDLCSSDEDTQVSAS